MHAKPMVTPQHLVWRISEQAPMGEWIDLAAPKRRIPASQLPAVMHSSWATSSFDLSDGASVIESGDAEGDTLFDDLFAASSKRADEK